MNLAPLSTSLTMAGYLEEGIGSVQLGMYPYRTSSYGRFIPAFGRFSSTYKFLGKTGKALGTLGYVAPFVATAVDYNSMQNSEISTGRFMYRTAFNFGALGTSMYVGAQFGGPWGAVAGTATGADASRGRNGI